jgi:hypothetical protein
MFLKFFRFPTFAALAVTFLALAAAGPAEARDWLTALERHEEAAAAGTGWPRGENPQWDFDLQTMMNDMKWRARTASMLRELPKPSAEARDGEHPSQLADKPETPRLKFSF